MRPKSIKKRSTIETLRSNRRKKDNDITMGNPNLQLLGLAAALLLFGVIMVFDASVYLASLPPFNNEFYFLQQHLVWILVSLIPALIIYYWDYHKIAKLSVPLLITNILLLIAVLFLAERINGSLRWFEIGPIKVQPAEFMKPIFIIYLSAWLSKERTKYSNFKDALKYGFGQQLIRFGVVFAVVGGLIVAEPDLGTTMIIGITAFSIFLASGTDKAHTVGSMLVAGGMAALGALAAILAPYRLERVKTYFQLLFSGDVADPHGAGYQISQILIGIGSAGWKGVGFGLSRQRFGYLVENTAFTDSIFAVYLEEMGLLGGILLIGAWVMFFLLGMDIARKAPDRIGSLMAVGITTWLTSQALLNMAANVGLIPLTGLPLPFFTYGGSNTLVTIVGVALLLNISRARKNGRHNTKVG
jgi:cell division protein FtsW